MPMIYKRFTEKSAEEWRQIYKVLGLYTPPLSLYKLFEGCLTKHFTLFSLCNFLSF